MLAVRILRMMSRAPTKSGGAKLYAKRRPGPEKIAVPALRALEKVVQTAMQIAIAASAIQVVSQASGVGWRDAIAAAPSAVMPMATPPQPGTAVKELARS